MFHYKNSIYGENDYFSNPDINNFFLLKTPLNLTLQRSFLIL